MVANAFVGYKFGVSESHAVHTPFAAVPGGFEEMLPVGVGHEALRDVAPLLGVEALVHLQRDEMVSLDKLITSILSKTPRTVPNLPCQEGQKLIEKCAMCNSSTRELTSVRVMGRRKGHSRMLSYSPGRILT